MRKKENERQINKEKYIEIKRNNQINRNKDKYKEI